MKKLVEALLAPFGLLAALCVGGGLEHDILPMGSAIVILLIASAGLLIWLKKNKDL